MHCLNPPPSLFPFLCLSKLPVNQKGTTLVSSYPGTIALLLRIRITQVQSFSIYSELFKHLPIPFYLPLHLCYGSHCGSAGETHQLIVRGAEVAILAHHFFLR